jgi:hypothetical protein
MTTDRDDKATLILEDVAPSPAGTRTMLRRRAGFLLLPLGLLAIRTLVERRFAQPVPKVQVAIHVNFHPTANVSLIHPVTFAGRGMERLWMSRRR